MEIIEYDPVFQRVFICKNCKRIYVFGTREDPRAELGIGKCRYCDGLIVQAAPEILLLRKQVDELEAATSGNDDQGYQRYKTYNPNPVKTYIQWLRTGMEYLEEAAHAAISGVNPAQYLATKAPTTLRDRIVELEARTEKQEEVLQEIARWADAYPLDIFPDYDLDAAQRALASVGIKIDQIGAKAMRHVVSRVSEIAKGATK